jgi:hypothetical protein
MSDWTDSCPICGFSDEPPCRHCGWTVSENRGLPNTKVPHPLRPCAKTLAEGVVPVNHGFDGFEPLRRLISETESRLATAGYNGENVGVECVSVGRWQSKHSRVANTRLFEYLVRDAVETHLWFYTAYHGYETFEELEENCTGDGATGYGSEQTLWTTYEWLQDISAPQEYAPVTKEDFSPNSVDVEVASADETAQASLTDL